MSYDFWLEFPKPKQTSKKKKGGPTPDELGRLARAQEIFKSFEPEIELEVEDNMFVAKSVELGEVFVEPNKITIGLSYAATPFRVYSCIHGLLKRFHGEDYVAVDPQLADEVCFAESFAGFMQQYRSQFGCSDDEFAIWCQGKTPQAWIDRAEALQHGAVIAAEFLPRGFLLSWQEYRALPDDGLWQHLQEVVARNDAAIKTNDLSGYIHALSEKVRASCVQSGRRLDGLYFPLSQDAPWWTGSLLHYEATILGELRARRFPGSAFDQPQQLRVAFQAYGEGGYLQDREARRTKLADQVREVFKASGLSKSGEMYGGADRWEYSYYGSDVEAMYEAAMSVLTNHAGTGLFALTKRYGDCGAREVEILISSPE